MTAEGVAFKFCTKIPNMRLIAKEYQLQRQISADLSGRLWQAMELSSRRQVLIRLLPKQLQADPASISRIKFRLNALKLAVQESQDLSSLVLPERFVELSGSESFLLSRFVEGDTVAGYAAKWIASDGFFPLTLIDNIFRPVAKILDSPYLKDFVHRSLTPNSILINRSDGVLLFDYELAGVIREQMIKIEPRLLADEIGIIRYMAPEILRGQAASPLSDQYALSMIIYELLAGRVLFDAANINGLLQQIISFIPPDLTAYPPEISVHLKRGLNKDPNLRFPTSSRLIESLIEVSKFEIEGQETYKIKQPESELFQIPKILEEIESAIPFNTIKTHMPKKITSKIIRRIHNERISQKIFFYCYCTIIVGSVVASVVFRDTLTSMIKSLLGYD
ncbi:MAG: protein kinase [Planctomycetaceae bacterium]|jgi:serine/threonine-protein kinase|nr:protein kinase [Planctomycetaceae bacterium]